MEKQLKQSLSGAITCLLLGPALALTPLWLWDLMVASGYASDRKYEYTVWAVCIICGLIALILGITILSKNIPLLREQIHEGVIPKRVAKKFLLKAIIIALVIVLMCSALFWFVITGGNFSGSNGSGGAKFTNKYGTPSTICEHTGCHSTIASSGDTNCCTVHSNRCGNCNCYIDEDAMFCMTCMKKYFD